MIRATVHALRAHVRRFRYGFLLLPMAVTVVLGALGVLATWLDSLAASRGIRLGLSADPDTARTILGAIAGAVATVASITFSIAIVALQLVSQQFSPRALRSFLGDRMSQVIAGVFVGTILYCVVVMRAVDGGAAGDGAFVPSIAVTAAMVLALGAFIALLLFVSHISQRVQVSRIARDIADAALESLGEIYPEPFGTPDPGAHPEALIESWRRERDPHRVYSTVPGYVQSAMIDDLPELLGGPGMRMHVCVAPGDFVALDEPLVEIWDARGTPEQLNRHLRHAILVQEERDLAQDYLYAVRQLADIATKALSPSLNDPTTAWTCIAYIGTVLERLVRRGLPARVLRYPDDIVVVVRRVELAEYMDVGFLQIGRYASRDPCVAGRILTEIARVARATSSPEHHAMFDEVAATIADPAREQATSEHDRREMARVLDRVREDIHAIH